MLFAEVLPQSCVVKSSERLVALLKPNIIQYIYSTVTLYLYFYSFSVIWKHNNWICHCYNHNSYAWNDHYQVCTIGISIVDRLKGRI